VRKGIKVDCIITDPPYGIDYQTFRTKREKLKNDDNLEWVEEFTYLCSKVLRKESHLYCFVDPEMSPEFILGFRKAGFKIRNLLTIPRAVKGNGGDRIFQQQNEFCIFATLGNKNQGRKFNQTKILKPSEGYLKDKRYKAREWLYRLPDYWHWTKASEHNSKNKLHPTQKSVECLKYMVELSTNKGEIVLDPYMGSGSTGVASIQLDRGFIGVEIDKTYFKRAKRRLKVKGSK
jgi:DNA modification methylase